MRGGGPVRVVFGIAAVALLALPGAAGATADLPRFLGCIGQETKYLCQAGVPAGTTALDDPVAVASSPNRTDVYATNSADPLGARNAIVHLRRQADGRLAFADCIGDGPADGCRSIGLGPAALLGPIAAAVSPDGRDLFVGTTERGQTLLRFRLGPDGVPQLAQCFTTGEYADGCVQIGTDDLLADIEVVLPSPDNADVYVVTARGVADFHRAADGSLTPGSCFLGADRCYGWHCPTSAGICGRSDWGRLRSAAITPDGRHVYVAGGNYDLGQSAVLRFDRSPSGRLAYRGCVGFGVDRCTSVESDPIVLGGATDVIASPDGRDLYVGTWFAAPDRARGAGAAIVHFSIGSDGSLAYADCLGSGDSTCSHTADDSLGGASMAFTADGSSLLAWKGTLARLHRAADGSLTYVGCGGAGAGCTPAAVDRAAFPADSTVQGEIAVNGGWLDVVTPAGIATHRLEQSEGVVGSGPATTTGPPGNITPYQADIAGGASIDQLTTAWLEWGLDTGYGQVTGARQSTRLDDTSIDAYSTIHRLRPSTTYHYRVVSRTFGGISRGADRTFTTPSGDTTEGPPAVAMGSIDGVTDHSAQIVARISTLWQTANYRVEYGPTSSYGMTMPWRSAPASDRGTFVVVPITGLSPGSTYHYRFVATAASGTTTTADETIETRSYAAPPAPPDIAPLAADAIMSTSARLHGAASSPGGPARASFLIRPAGTGAGWTPEGDVPLAQGTAPQAADAIADGLQPSTRYEYRLSVATDDATFQSDILTFTTPATDPAQAPPSSDPPGSSPAPAGNPPPASGQAGQPGSATEAAPTTAASFGTPPVAVVPPHFRVRLLRLDARHAHVVVVIHCLRAPACTVRLRMRRSRAVRRVAVRAQQTVRTSLLLPTEVHRALRRGRHGVIHVVATEGTTSRVLTLRF